MKRTLTLTMTALALTTSVAAQEVMVAYPVAQAPLIKERIEARAAVESRITTGAPYSAEAVTESLQVLSDGNRIARKTTTRVYRDSEGRTRREQLTSTGTVQSVTISDPVAGSMYVLNPAERTAHRNGVMMAGPGGGFSVASVAPGSSGTVTAVRTADGGVRVSASESNEAGRRRETEAQVAGGGSAGVAAGERDLERGQWERSRDSRCWGNRLSARGHDNASDGGARLRRRPGEQGRSRAASDRGRSGDRDADDDDDPRRLDRQRAADSGRV